MAKKKEVLTKAQKEEVAAMVDLPGLDKEKVEILKEETIKEEAREIIDELKGKEKLARYIINYRNKDGILRAVIVYGSLNVAKEVRKLDPVYLDIHRVMKDGELKPIYEVLWKK